MKPLPLSFLKESGLLFEMNRTVLHPLGLTLQVGADGSMELLQTDDPAGMVFSARTFIEGESAILEFMAKEGASRLASRRAFLQYVEQTDPDQSGSDSLPPPSGRVG